MSLIEKELINARRERDEARTEAAAMRRERDELDRQNAELAARLAEIEAQEPVAWEYDCLGWEPVMSTYRLDVNEFSPTARERPLYARPVPTQAAPERAEPVAWVPVHPREGALWAMTTATPSDERLPSHYPLAPLYTSPAAAPERAEPADGCGACGDACAERGSCRLADESPEHKE